MKLVGSFLEQTGRARRAPGLVKVRLVEASIPAVDGLDGVHRGEAIVSRGDPHNGAVFVVKVSNVFVPVVAVEAVKGLQRGDASQRRTRDVLKRVGVEEVNLVEDVGHAGRNGKGHGQCHG